MGLYAETDEVTYGQGSSDGDFDDVETYGADGEPQSGTGSDSPSSGETMAGVLIAAALVALWAMGAFVFKGSNQS
jgi:hypothetical protein